MKKNSRILLGFVCLGLLSTQIQWILEETQLINTYVKLNPKNTC